MNEELITKAVSDLLLTGGSSTGVTLVLAYAYYQYKHKEKSEEITRDMDNLAGKLKSDRTAFNQFMSEYKELVRRLYKLETRVDDDIIEIKQHLLENIDKQKDLKNAYAMQELRINNAEVRERQTDDEVNKMDSDIKLLKNDLDYMRRDIGDIKTAISELTRVVTDMKDELIKVVARVN
jgi:chromosome segregation ATPase